MCGEVSRYNNDDREIFPNVQKRVRVRGQWRDDDDQRWWWLYIFFKYFSYINKNVLLYMVKWAKNCSREQEIMIYRKYVDHFSISTFFSSFRTFYSIRKQTHLNLSQKIAFTSTTAIAVVIFHFHYYLFPLLLNVFCPRKIL